MVTRKSTNKNVDFLFLGQVAGLTMGILCRPDVTARGVDTWEHIVPMLGAGRDRRYFFHVHDGLPANRPSPKWGQIGPSFPSTNPEQLLFLDRQEGQLT